MGFDAETMLARVVTTLAKSNAPLAGYVSRLIEARRRRIAHEREFYRNLKAYCRANNLSPVCEDDWKTAAYDNNDDNLSVTHSKGNVPWTKVNLPR